MGQTLTGLYTHIIHSTEGRAPGLAPEIAPRVYAYLGGIARECGATAIIINGWIDHVHQLVDLPPTMAVSDLVRILKANSSRWIHEAIPAAKAFALQTGYAAFAVSRLNIPAVKHYIAELEAHHRQRTFQAEMIEFLKRHEIPYDPKYIWT